MWLWEDRDSERIGGRAWRIEIVGVVARKVAEEVLDVAMDGGKEVNDLRGASGFGLFAPDLAAAQTGFGDRHPIPFVLAIRRFGHVPAFIHIHECIPSDPRPPRARQVEARCIIQAVRPPFSWEMAKAATPASVL